MWLFAFLVSMLVAQAFVAGPALGQARGRAFSGSSSPRMPGPGVGGPMTGDIGDTLGATPNTGSSMSGGIPGTFDATPFNSGSSTTRRDRRSVDTGNEHDGLNRFARQ
jgi:hypothetical protein